MVRHGVVLLLGVLFLLGVVRPFARGVVTALQARPKMLPAELPRTVTEMEAMSQPGKPVPSGQLTASTKAPLPAEVVQMAEMDPQRFAAALKAWMKQGD